MMMNRTLQYVTGLAVASVFLAGSLPVRADGITSEQAQQILDELKAIRKNLEQRPIAPSCCRTGAGAGAAQ